MTAAEGRWLAGAVGFSLVVRLLLFGAVLVVRGDVAAFHTADSAGYLELAASLARLEAFGTGGQPELFRLPGFPLLLAIASWIGDATLTVLVIHAILGGITTWICFLWARSIGGTRAGLLGAWLFALEPGGWTWSTFVLTETLFTALLALACLAATLYVRNRRRLALLGAVTLAAACAYVRLVGYVLPFVIIAASGIVVWRENHGVSRRNGWRDATLATMLAVVLLGTWHVRNGVTSGYWGFSTQVERAAFIVGGGVAEARRRGSYTEAARALRKEVDQDDRSPALVAAEMRRTGLRQIAQTPLAFFTTYAAGVAATLVHPGTGGLLRLFESGIRDDLPSVTQMLTLGRLENGRRLAASKSNAYWVLTALLFPMTLIYLGLFAAGAWARRHSPGVLLACMVAAGILALSGGPDGDSRRRAPLAPLMSVIGGTYLACRSDARRPI